MLELDCELADEWLDCEELEHEDDDELLDELIDIDVEQEDELVNASVLEELLGEEDDELLDSSSTQMIDSRPDVWPIRAVLVLIDRVLTYESSPMTSSRCTRADRLSRSRMVNSVTLAPRSCWVIKSTGVTAMSQIEMVRESIVDGAGAIPNVMPTGICCPLMILDGPMKKARACEPKESEGSHAGLVVDHFA